MSAAVATAWERIQLEAQQLHEEHWGTFFAHRDELQRVMNHFGHRAALDFAASEHEVPELAFLVEFDLLNEGERLGVFAL